MTAIEPIRVELVPREPLRVERLTQSAPRVSLPGVVVHDLTGGSSEWGGITGELGDQADLSAALAAKLDDSQAGAGGLAVLGAADAAGARTALELGSAALAASVDFAPAAHVGAVGTAHANAVAGGAAGFLTGTDKTKLDALGTASAAALDADTALAANSDANVPTQKAVKAYVDNAVIGLFDFKGSTDCSANPNYPAALKGDSYVVTVGGKIGGASGKSVDAGDLYLATADNAGGTEAAVGASWVVLEHNLAGALLAANNLSDLTDPAAARTNLALGTAATSAAVDLLARANHTGSQVVSTIAASATSRLFGRVTAGAGAGEELTGAQATALLDVFTSGAKGLAPASGGGTVNFLRADSTWAPAGSGDVVGPLSDRAGRLRKIP